MCENCEASGKEILRHSDIREAGRLSHRLNCAPYHTFQPVDVQAMQLHDVERGTSPPAARPERLTHVVGLARACSSAAAARGRRESLAVRCEVARRRLPVIVVVWSDVYTDSSVQQAIPFHHRYSSATGRACQDEFRAAQQVVDRPSDPPHLTIPCCDIPSTNDPRQRSRI